MEGRFHWIDWAVLVAYIAGTSWLADRLAGSKQTIRDFFLGGRKLPWWAVAGSIVASEVSGVTFVAVPAGIFAAGGNFTFMMLAIGTILARVVIAGWIVPAYYRHEIYSPYEFMGRRLGPQVDRITTVMFFVGAFLAQGARLFVAALVLDTIVAVGVVWCILIIGGISVVWTWVGGINSVVWTDVVQFVILFVGGAVALVAAISAVPGGISEIVRIADAAGKLRVLDVSLNPRTPYTLWAGLFGMGCLTLASHGTDQIMAQRIFCCKDVRDARKAVVWSGVSQVLPLLMLAVGAGIYAYYTKVPMTARELQKLGEYKDNLFPLFILRAMPVGVKGLLFAAIFSAATATGTLAAMAQTGLAAFYTPFLKKPATDAHLIFVSRILVLISAVGLCLTAILCSAIQSSQDSYKGLLDLALAMAGYTYGAMLGILLLAMLPTRRDARGLLWAVPVSMLTVFALSWNHLAWARTTVAVAIVPLVLSAGVRLRREPLSLLWALLGVMLLLAVAWVHPPLKLAWPWHFPIGAAITLGLGVALGRKRELTEIPAPVS